MKLNLSVPAIALSCFLMSPWSAAEDQPAASMEEISVSATRDDRPLYNVPAAVGLVDREAIGSGRQMIGLDESLMRIPGLFMQNRYNFAHSLKVSRRGFGAPRVSNCDASERHAVTPVRRDIVTVTRTETVMT